MMLSERHRTAILVVVGLTTIYCIFMLQTQSSGFSLMSLKGSNDEEIDKIEEIDKEIAQTKEIEQKLAKNEEIGEDRTKLEKIDEEMTNSGENNEEVANPEEMDEETAKTQEIREDRTNPDIAQNKEVEQEITKKEEIGEDKTKLEEIDEEMTNSEKNNEEVVNPEEMDEEIAKTQEIREDMTNPDINEENVNTKATVEETDKTDACTIPDINPFDPVIMKYVKKHPTISCQKGSPSLVYLNGNSLMINKRKFEEKFGANKRTLKGCTYKRLTMKVNNDKVATASEPIFFSISIRLSNADDNLYIECFDNNHNRLSKQYMYVLHEKPRVEERSKTIYRLHQENNKPKETLSVLMIGQDGTSKQAFQRSMPKTRAFVLNQMDGLELHKYNMVGPRTFPNVLVLLTGRSEHEFSEWNNSFTLDDINYAFIWNDFRLAGYRTSAVVGDRAVGTAWHWFTKGWRHHYVDYSSRPMIVAADSDTEIRKESENCVGDTPEIELLLKQWTQLTAMYHAKEKPYFGYHFTCRITHDDVNKASSADDFYYDFFSKLHNNHVLNNTLLIWFSDHGPRFGEIRGTYNGLIEGKLPFMFFIFPPWFYKKYPDIYKTLKINQHRLTSNFDIYATLKDVITFDGETGKGDIGTRGISLFKEIPRERTCTHAGVPAEHCACVNLDNANIKPIIVDRLSRGLLAKIRKLGNKKLCERLYVDQVITLLEKKDKNYQMTMRTKPGGGLYEAMLKLTPTKEVEVIGEINRVNRYHGTAECVNNFDQFPYCYCKIKPDENRMKQVYKANR